MRLPKSRTDNIVIQSLLEEVLIYDLMTDRAYCLNKTSAVVFNACNGKTSVSDLKSESRLPDEMIFLALDELKRANLLEKDADYGSPFAGMTRREVIRKAGLNSLIALPVISALVAPTAAQAQSGVLTFTCSNPGSATSSFCAATLADCNTPAKTLCATCGATGSTGGLCAANPPGGNQITCICGGVCSNPGAAVSSFCVSSPTECATQSRTLCANCSATVSSSGLCGGNPPGGAVLTCTCV
jgi:hypothetical protein